MKKRKKVVGALLGCAVLLSMPMAQAEEAEFGLDEYVVTANRMPVKKTEAAASITVITREEIEKTGVSSVVEALKRTTVSIQNDRTASVPTINGEVRTLVLVDGREVNWKGGGMHMGQSGANLDVMPSIDSVERIEIVRGAGSALYGSDAVGGVINIITRKGQKKVTEYTSEVGGWGMRRYKLSTEDSSGDVSFRLNLERQHTDDFHYKRNTGENVQAQNTDEDHDTVNFRLDKELGKDALLTLTMDHDSGEKGLNVMPDYQTFLASGGSTNYFANIRQHYVENNVALTYRWKLGERTNNFLKLYRNHFTYDYRNHMDYRYPDYYFNGVSYTNRADGAEWQQTWKINDSHTLLGGASWRKTTAESREYDIPFMGVTGYNYSGKSITNKAFFLENSWRLPHDWSLTAGVRHDSYTLFGNKTTSRFSINKQMNQNTNVYASWGQIFKTPFIADVYGGGFMVPNLSLRPEKGEVVTVGVNTHLGNGTELQASLFSSRLTDALDYVAVGVNKYQWQNVAELKRKGVELSLKQQLSSKWSASVGYSHVSVEEQGVTKREEFNNNEPNGYRLGVEYSQGKWNADMNIRGATGRNKQAFSSSSYWVTDLGVRYKSSPDTQLYLKVYNLTNTSYELHGCYGDASGAVGLYPMSGRQIVLGMTRKL